jgi:succinyl-diaminopimelate desuccinylase
MISERLATRTLELVDIPSVSRDEAAVLSWIRAHMPGPQSFELVDDEDSVLFYIPVLRRPAAPFVLLAGHVDTVPVDGNVPGVREGGTDPAVVGRGASDMKGSLAVMVEVAEALAGDIGSDIDVGFLFFGREELPINQSALLPLFARSSVAGTIDLAVVMEPTDNTIEVGCLGNLSARVVVHGTAAHSARPWLGDNAIHRALGVLGVVADAPVRDVEIEGMIYREAMSVTTIAGGSATNVIPDRVEADINVRYAPSTAPEDAEARLRALLEAPGVDVTVVGNAPPGPVTVMDPLVERLRLAGELPLGPKQAWTPVAEFATIGVDAVNLGPGDPQYAHRQDERVRVDALVRSYHVLRAFLSGDVRSEMEEGTG